MGDWFNLGGVQADLGYYVENVELDSRTIAFNLNDLAEHHVTCSW